MRYKPEHKEASRAAMLKAAGEAFRQSGYTGVGVDGLAQAAGMTSGAFYKHFGSKRAAFRDVVRAGMERMLRRVRRLQGAHAEAPDGGAWVDEFITSYFSREHLDATAQGCALPTLTVEVSRADDEIRELYQGGILTAAKAMAERPPFAGAPDALERALAVLALAAGGASLARAFKDPEEAERMAEAARKAASQIAHGGLPASRPAGPWRWSPPV